MTTIKINGVPYTANVQALPADITLNTFIREHAQLTATKYMCQEGGCGACVCVVRSKDPVTGQLQTKAVNSCLTLLNTCIDVDIITAEGLGTGRTGYHPIQTRLAKMNGTQCGFCSPGFVMNMYGLLESKEGKVTMNEVENAFGGNICRCTGYRPILDAMKSFAVDSNIAVPAECRDIEDLSARNCPKTGLKCASECLPKNSPNANGTYLRWAKSITNLYETVSKAYAREHFLQLPIADGSQWYWPTSMASLYDALDKVGSSQEFILVSGNTAHGVYRRSPEIKHFIDMHGIPELQIHSITEDKLTLGGNMSLTAAMDIFEKSASQSGFEYCSQLWQHFDLIANIPVRNSGTLAGNIAIKKAHPEFPSDIFITFEALDVQVLVHKSAKEKQEMSLSDYLKDKSPKLVLAAFILKAYPKDQFVFKSYKIMPRAQNAHAYVNAAFLLELNSKDNKVKSARICFGSIRPGFVHATTIESLLVEHAVVDAEFLPKAFEELTKIIQPDEVLPDPSPVYRRQLACGLFYKFLLSIAPKDAISDANRSGADILSRPLSSGLQTFKTVEKNYPVTKAIQKVEGMIQCSGEATYMNDVLTASNTLHCAFVGGKNVGAILAEIDASEALAMPGVVAFFSKDDIPGINSFCGDKFNYVLEEIFVIENIRYYDQPVGVIVAVSATIAQRAAEKVKVIYFRGLRRRLMLQITDVLEYNRESRIVESMIMFHPQLSGKPDESGRGIFEMGLQYHFTMEPHTAVVIPFEGGLRVYSSTQWMDHTQAVIAGMLHIKANEVKLEVRRLGGGYGAKITRSNQVACAAALAAYKLNRPVRFVQTIESMMNTTGKRWACRSDYEFQIKSNGKIVGLKNEFYEDAGWCPNESPVDGHSTFNSKNCYEFTSENCIINGKEIITDAPSSTWCRAPGSVEGIAMIENILEHIAFEVNADPADVRLINIAKGNKLAELLPKFLKSREYKARRKEIDTYNSKNRWLKRGLGLAIMDYPILYCGHFPATVAIYHADGTVVVTHGGIEMGQGMNTKIAQVAAYTLGIDLSYIKIESSDTINGANAFVTGGAVGSESVCYAVRKACETLNSRLKPVKDELKNKGSWEQVVDHANDNNINMIASEGYKFGDMKNYNIYGIALTEVTVDMLTGNTQVKRVDILEDAGESLSPYIDVGQVEGGFVMLLGYWLSEKLIFDRKTGKLLTNRTWNYKPPGAKDIPIDFRIELIQNPMPDGAGFMRSKATGEPPCCLAVSVIFAIQHALQSARKDANLPKEWVRLGAPTTPETILLNSGFDPMTLRL